MPAKQLLATTLSLALYATATTGLAQQVSTEAPEEKEIRWYQIELLAFSQNVPNQAQEQWRTDIALAYPPNWQRLKQPLQLAPLAEDTEENTASAEEAAPSTDGNTPLGTDLEREPYYLLPEEQRELNNNARALARDKRYRVLFHESWRQPVVDIDNAPSLLIHGGEIYGEHQELEGSITISVARYLHLHTNLWLSEFTRNYGQNQQSWRQDSDSKDWPMLPIRPDLRKVESQDWMPLATQEDAWSGLTSLETEYDKILNQPYVLDQVVLLKQKRRMRSGELHFIDHPLVGLLIKITPYELPEEIEEETQLMDGDTALIPAAEATATP
ncbi:CsiV family protein [Maricurvus nonylphenolicus]|uniref:CsiV family protein n=1 Tax=Maricurvus nonylphenolicus TaxID=1008307 RepID=UPI0036F3EE8E